LGNGDGTFLPGYAIWSEPISFFVPLVNGLNSFTVGDFNGDGNLDIAANVNGARVDVLLGTGTGVFVPAPIPTYVINQHQGGHGLGEIVSEKLSSNGQLDLVVGTGYGATLAILRGNGDGTFQSPTIYPLPQDDDEGLIVADLNGDGSPDIVVGTATFGIQKYLTVLLNNGNADFGEPPPLFPVVARYDSPTVILTNAVGVVLADLTGSGKLDLITTDWNEPIEPLANGQMPALPTFNTSTTQANTYSTISVLPGNGDGSFGTEHQYYVGGRRPISPAVADLTGDGKMDLAIVDGGYFFASDDAGKHTQLSILSGNGDGTFQPASNQKLWDQDGGDALIAADFGRGEIDLAVAHFGLGQVMILQGKGD